MTLNVNHNNFQPEVIGADTSVLVDFYSDSCIHCVNISPIIDELAAEYTADSFKIVKFDVHESKENNDLAVSYKVRGLPHLVLFENGEIIDRKIGYQTKDILQEWLANRAQQYRMTTA